ncbi:Thiamin pyrophosphokinase, catalytic domain [Jannaschia aquimarina]|uniref:Thiamine diphosphokinase n=1 Tax=Jannaschia aquimarina TaxID=935700 RepID=A0A0D1CSD0_9RHOB|nr:Thiamin pyrophosphokinase, catalytic domain [Jannaschia aquimarina]SNS79039.1 thiamine diphosphokinase [Jannaschia aquimarina]
MPDLQRTVQDFATAETPSGGVTLVGGGPVPTLALKAALNRAPRVVAADGGADACLAADLLPELVVGDLDSIGEAARHAYTDRIVHVSEQDSTDFAKALHRIEAPFVLAVGFLGARFDHALAAISHLGMRTGPPVLLLSDDDALAMCPTRLRLDLPTGTRVSLWPLAEVRLTSTGLRWPLDGLVLRPDGRVGTSNRATGPVTLTCDGPCLVILPLDALDPLMAGLGIAGTDR